MEPEIIDSVTILEEKPSDDIIAIKDKMIADLSTKVKALTVEIAVLKNNLTSLEIDLQTAKSTIDAQTTASEDDKVASEYLSDEEALAEVIKDTLIEIKEEE